MSVVTYHNEPEDEPEGSANLRISVTLFKEMVEKIASMDHYRYAINFGTPDENGFVMATVVRSEYPLVGRVFSE